MLEITRDNTSTVVKEKLYLHLGTNLLAIVTASTTEQIISDHIGYPIATLNTQGTLLWHADHKPFGEISTTPYVGSAANDPLRRYPGQWQTNTSSFTPPSNLVYSSFRWYNPWWGRYTQGDPLGLRGGINLFSYVLNSPFHWIDPLGLKVYMCCAPAEIFFGLVDHCWIRTDTLEAGMGNLNEGQPAGKAVPGGQCDMPFITQTQIVTHAGESEKRPGATCTEIPNVDEECVSKQIWTNKHGYGQTTGAFSPTNNCQTWANSVLYGCKTNCEPAFTTPPWPPPVIIP